MANIENYTLNFGPQHPAAHGVLRLILELNGETIMRADPHIGLLHRGTEKLAEAKPYNQSIGYMDRMDYSSCMCNEHTYVLAIEKALGIEPPIRAKYIRSLFDEIYRLQNHLMWLGAHGIDLGAMGMLLYCFRDREDLMDMCEATTGARLHQFFYRPGGVAKDIPDVMPKYEVNKFRNQKKVDRLNKPRESFTDFVIDFTHRFEKHIEEYKTLLFENRIWKQRVVGIGTVTAEEAMNLGLTGPMLRGSGVAWDLRKTQPYAAYEYLDFDIPVGKNGDCYDRFLVRVEEMYQSNRIIRQCAQWLAENPGPVMLEESVVSPPKRAEMKESMEDLIQQFKLYSEGYCVPEGEVYAAIEHPKGEMGVYLISDGANKPYRMKVRPAGFPHLAALETLTKGHMLGDLIAVIGTLDLVFGDIDR
ncbi:NADH-quinone oxidoreductase subunit D [Wohlfahrtiimonas chitiniclastica]|uniref:NADH-quinone oxidoreductase subunit D n=2 Tax=Wohlfahrtiimonas chitiniclastica TaxID=400946 RepID=L8XYF3_9GAMM|nr:NADH-quinone oxidoreductase subunit D [Wohlfahrtiimonas chitiniclastica]ELV07849.1 NADH-quinone oxidoreductase subunit D [Wohlfahrtiimonas chitiniclastica SH04]KZX36919.1 NADH dehydrogenase [Wohlfahrtiimonas chitiniclastica]MBS7815380.1 NADH-quinone oxidoreductase subunit D [Wohlfahrtiimonas chitiniclastica]MBS7817442.1 NADH-quinone oxidoreductase subunit D [Wohlfahrtiimonas chitiniclastica]MBS7819278.1 NADH-quinone oxidoreductase subunit D [Wohlfahrtiimonas chitiniclastica]